MGLIYTTSELGILGLPQQKRNEIIIECLNCPFWNIYMMSVWWNQLQLWLFFITLLNSSDASLSNICVFGLDTPVSVVRFNNSWCALIIPSCVLFFIGFHWCILCLSPSWPWYICVLYLIAQVVYSMFSVDCFLLVPNFTIQIIFLSMVGWG